MTGGISIHVVDIARGIVAVGMRVELFALAETPRLLCDGRVGAKGALDHPRLGRRFEDGRYELAFHVAEFYRNAGIALPAVPFLEVAPFRFGIADPRQHYHFPLKVTPWGYSLFRGGA